jgi:hypothetical protein
MIVTLPRSLWSWMGAVADQIYDVACLDVGFRGAQPPPPVVVRPAATAQQMQKPRRDRIWE